MKKKLVPGILYDKAAQRKLEKRLEKRMNREVIIDDGFVYLFSENRVKEWSNWYPAIELRRLTEAWVKKYTLEVKL